MKKSDYGKYRICHICPSFNNSLYSQMVERQIKVNEKVRVFYYRAKGTGLPNGDKEYVDGVLAYRNCERLFYYLKESKIVKKFFELYRSDNYDIFHAHTLFSAGYIALKAKRELGTPYIVAVRGTDVNLFFKYRVYLRKLGIRIMEEAEAIVFISHAHKEKVVECYLPQSKRRALERKMYVIPNGINDFWHNNKNRENKPIGNKEVNLIYYGDINRNKNLEVTIKAIENLIEQGYNIHFFVIGKILDKRYKKLLEKKQFIQYYDFMPKEELIECLRNAHIFVMPSKSETFGLAYVEAMSQGIPVIYSEGQGFDKQFDEGVVGYHVKSSSSEEIVEAIEKILDDYMRLSENCVRYVEKYSWDSIVSVYQDIYRKIVND